MKIFNIKQADLFIKNGCTVIGCGLGNKYKTYIEFLEDECYNSLMLRWKNKEF